MKNQQMFLHDFPDRDAIFSAFAHKPTSAEYDIEPDIVHTGKISHSQNIAPAKLPGVELTNYDGNIDFGKYQGSVSFGNQGTIMGDLSASGIGFARAEDRDTVPHADARIGVKRDLLHEQHKTNQTIQPGKNGGMK